MSEQDARHEGNDGADERRGPPETGGPSARLRRTPWRGWIWSVPLAAMLLVGYVVIRTWVLAGPTVTVTFPSAGGITAPGTAVKYLGMQVGTVERVRLSDDDRRVVLTLAMNGSVANLLRTGTRFWIAQPSILSGDVTSLISGAHVEMRPGAGESARHFEGLGQPPPIEPTQPGQRFTLHAQQTGSIKRGTEVMYHGVQAGQVLAVDYDDARNQVRFTVFVRQPFVDHVTGRTRFWRSGALRVSTAGGGVNVKVPPIQSLLTGAIAFDTFAGAAEDAGGYRLYDSERQARRVLRGPRVVFAVHFPGSVGDLDAGSPVEFRGFRVGEVRSVSLEYDARQQRMAAPVSIALYPSQFGIASKELSADEATEALRQLIARLVRRGLRAQLNSASLLLGGEQVSLVMAGKPGERTLDLADEPARLPAIPGGSIDSVIASIGRITDKLNALPIQSIGQNLEDSLAHLDQALVNVRDLTAETEGQIAPTLASLRGAADGVESLAREVETLAAGSPGAPEGIQNLVSELTRTAESIRMLANYLQRHPEALIQGRSG